MEWRMILGHTKLASVPKRYTLKPLFKPETCTSSPPNADMVSSPLKTFLLLQFTLSSVPVLAEFVLANTSTRIDF
jgi:hypothetical protein